MRYTLNNYHHKGKNSNMDDLIKQLQKNYLAVIVGAVLLIVVVVLIVVSSSNSDDDNEGDAVEPDVTEVAQAAEDTPEVVAEDTPEVVAEDTPEVVAEDTPEVEEVDAEETAEAPEESTPEVPDLPTGTTTIDRVSARQCPFFTGDCPVVEVLRINSEVMVIARERGQRMQGNRDWWLVSYEGTEMYIHDAVLAQNE